MATEGTKITIATERGQPLKNETATHMFLMFNEQVSQRGIGGQKGDRVFPLGVYE